MSPKREKDGRATAMQISSADSSSPQGPSVANAATELGIEWLEERRRRWNGDSMDGGLMVDAGRGPGGQVVLWW